PITRKEDIVAAQRESPPFGGFATISATDMERVCVSPGPIFEPLAQLGGGAKAFTVIGFGPGDVAIVTTSYHMVPAGMLYEGALRLVGATVVATGPGNTELQIQTMRQLKATAYVGFPRFLLSIIQRAEEMGYNFRRDFSIRKALVGGEMFTPSMKRTMEEKHGIETWEHYGTADLGLVAYECPARSGLHIYEGVVMEVVDPATGKQLPPGQPGEVVVTTFSKDYPLIRYGTGDAAFYTDEPCACGRTMPRLVDILGRVGDAPRVRGLFLVPKEVAETVGAFSQVKAFQVAVRLAGL
ncbi:MAG: AMP-binding protein, partial [Chloroflexota bacterium]